MMYVKENKMSKSEFNEATFKPVLIEPQNCALLNGMRVVFVIDKNILPYIEENINRFDGDVLVSILGDFDGKLLEQKICEAVGVSHVDDAEARTVVTNEQGVIDNDCVFVYGNSSKLAALVDMVFDPISPTTIH